MTLARESSPTEMIPGGATNSAPAVAAKDCENWR
jgi:hypothetical protein